MGKLLEAYEKYKSNTTLEERRKNFLKPDEHIVFANSENDIFLFLKNNCDIAFIEDVTPTLHLDENYTLTIEKKVKKIGEYEMQVYLDYVISKKNGTVLSTHKFKDKKYIKQYTSHISQIYYLLTGNQTTD